MSGMPERALALLLTAIMIGSAATVGVAAVTPVAAQTGTAVPSDDTDDPPVLDPIENRSVAVNETATVRVTATDPNGDALSLAATNLPSFASFGDGGDGTGTLTLRPDAGDEGTYRVTVVASDGNRTDSRNVTVTVTDDPTTDRSITESAAVAPAEAPGDGTAGRTEVAITPDSGASASTYSSGAFEVTNNGSQNIAVLRFDTSSAFVPDLVFDPNGTAGDGGGKDFTADSGAAAVGVVDHQFLNPENGVDGSDGYTTLEVTFDDFQPGETLTFSADMDPTSIKGVSSPGPGDSGSISGLELAGSTVEVEYADGTTQSITTFGDGSDGGGQATVRDSPPAAPSVGVAGVSLESTTLSDDHTGAVVSDASQTITVSGPAGATVRLIRAEAGLFLEGVPDGGYDVEAYEANNVIDVDEYTATLGADGSAQIPVTLTNESDAAEPGRNYFVAAVENASGTGTVSNTVVLDYEASDDTSGSDVPVSFGSSDLDLSGMGLKSPTAIDFGPDGRLYVSTVSGEIYALTVQRNGENDYQVTDSEVITTVDAIPNHEDDGSLAPDVNGRQVTGLLAAGTAQNPVLYVSSSDPRIGGKQAGEDTGLDTNSGIISRLTWDGSSWNHLQLVRGLPRSEENHAPNGLALDEQNGVLYLAQGGNTGQGAPSNELAYLPEYAYSAAILEIDLAEINAMSTKTGPDSPTPYKYNLPTLKGTAQPWGGQDGLNQAILTNDSPVQIYSPGYRNPYDLTITEDGQMYTADNGGSSGWGGPPVNEGPGGVCTNEPNNGGEGQQDQLHLVTEGFYGGHPNPTRGNPDGAGVYDGDGNELVDFNASYTPVPFDMAQDRQCDLLDPGTEDDALTTFGSSTNGLTEYTASNFGGQMEGDLLAVSFAGSVWRIELDSTGESVVSKNTLFSNFGGQPLGITTQGNNEPFAGTVWVANYGSNDITVFEPTDYDGSGGQQCTGDDDPSIDEDGDGYDNADELDAGTDPCSAADKPADFDDDGVSNVNDPDDDNDGIDDTADPFAIDPDNGLTTDVPVRYDFEAGSQQGTLFDAGFTGLMTNGTDYQSLYNESHVTASGIAGVLSIDNPTGDPVANNQTYGFQFGVNTPDEPFTVHTRTENAFVDDPSTEDFQSTGVSIGPGDQDNYIKLVANADDGDVAIALAREDGGTYQTVASQSLGDANDLGPWFDLYLRVYPGNDTVVAEYSLDDGSTVVTVGQTSIDSEWLDHTQQGLGVGVLATHRGAPYQATWGTIEVERTGNQAPTLDDIPNQSIEERETRTLQVSASDPDEDTLTLTTSGLPSFATFTDAGDGTGNLTLAPQDGDTGTYEFTVEASDGNLSDSRTVTVTVTENRTVLYRVNAGGSGLATGAEGPDWSADTSGSPSPYHNGVSQTSNYAGQAISVDDTVPSSTPEAVFDTARWDPSRGEEMQWAFPVESGVSVEVRLYFVDAWSGTSQPGDRVFDVAIEGETVLDNYDIVADVGPNTGTTKSFVVTSDGTVNVDFDHVTENPIVAGVEIVSSDENASTNVAPTLDPIADQSVTENETATVPVSASDPNDDPLTLMASGLPPFATFADGGDGTGQLSFAPQEGDAGTYEFTVTASDGNLSDTQTVTVTVNENGTTVTNQPPELDPIADQSVTENETATVPVSASDPNGDPLTLTTSGLPPFATFTDGGDGTGQLSFAPQGGDAGIYEFTVTASDGDLSDTQTVTVTVNENETTEPGESAVLYRVNAGGGSLAATDGSPDWSADTGGSPSPYHNGVSKTSNYAGQAISVDDTVPSSTPAAVFDTARWDPSRGEEMQWAFPVESGVSVEVRLYFVDAYSGTSQPGDRVFDVAIEGETVLDDYDIVADVGPNTGTTKSFVVTSDGTVNVDFDHVTENPIVAGVEIVSSDENASTNVAPTLDPIADQSVTENETATVPVSASDPNDDPLTLMASGLPPFATFADGGDGTGQLSFAPQEGDAGTYEFTVTASDGNLSDTQTVTVTVNENGTTEPGESTVLYRVNAGGGSLAATDGSPDWSADTGGSPSQHHNGVSQTSSYAGQAISVDDTVPSSTPEAVFDTARWDPSRGEEMQWAFPVESGSQVEVRLYFVDAYSGTSQPGDRVFDVTIEGETVLDDYDIVADVGPNTGTTKSFVVTSDGTVNVDFDHVTENPIVAGVEIVGAENGTANSTA